MHRAVAPEWWPWGFTEELLAQLVEVVDLGNRLYVQAHQKPGSQPPRPIRIPRPYDNGDASAPRRQGTTEEIIAMFSQGGGKVVTE